VRGGAAALPSSWPKADTQGGGKFRGANNAGLSDTRRFLALGSGCCLSGAAAGLPSRTTEKTEAEP